MGRRLLVVLAVSAALIGPRAVAAPPSGARQAVAAFLAHLDSVRIADLVVEQSLTLYHPSGRHVQLMGEQRVLLKAQGRQRVEQIVDGRREVRLTVGDAVWIRESDGRTYEAPPSRERSPVSLLLSPARRPEDLLAEWRSLGVRDSVTHVTRVGGRPVTVIGAAPGDRQSPCVWIDEEYGVVRFVTRERLPTGPALVDMAFSEHRRLPQGFFFPYRQEVFVDGKLAVLVIVRSVVVDAGLPDALFDPGALRHER